MKHGPVIFDYIWFTPVLWDIEAQHLRSRAISISELYCDPPNLSTSAMDQLLAQRTLSLLHHLMRLVLQLHGSILANIEGLESQFGHRGTTLPAHHPYSSSMAPMDTPILLPGLSTTSTHSSHPSATASFPLYPPSLHRQHQHTTKRTLSPQPHPPATKHHRINPRADTPAPPATPKTAGPTPAARRSKAPRAGATHRTPTTPPAITRQQRRRPDHRRTSRTHGQSLIQPPSRLQSQQQSHHHRRVRLAPSQHHGLLKKTKPLSASKATPKHARAGLPSAQECDEHLQNVRQDGNCSACNRQPPRKLRRRRLLHPLILDRRDLLHLIHSLLVTWDA